MRGNNQIHPFLQQQKGIALIYVLLIFSMITLMATQIMTSLLLHTDKNTQYIERTQAKHYAMSAEQYVSYLLEEDFLADRKKQRQVDHEKERWNVKSLDYELDQGKVELAVIDEQSRFNINWLMSQGNEGKKSLQMFQNLLLTQSLDIELANKVQVWLGVSPEALKAAADNDYLMLLPARRAGNAEMSSVSELRLVQGITAEHYFQLAPLISALPKDTKINLNTALPEVIRSISEKITEGDALAIIEGRGDEGFTKIEEIGSISGLNEKMAEIRSAPVSFFSQYFTVYIKATYRETSFYLKTRLRRSNSGKVQVAGREIGPNTYWITSNKES